MSSDIADLAGVKLLRRGRALEGVTLLWNVVGVVVVAVLAVRSGSVALAGFGLDSLIEIGASTVVLWELAGSHPDRQRVALRLIGLAFAALGLYLLAQSGWALLAHHVARPSPVGMAWTGVTAIVMFLLAFGKRRTGQALGNPVLLAEGKVTVVDGLLAVAVLIGLALNAVFGWWWADPRRGVDPVRLCSQREPGTARVLAVADLRTVRETWSGPVGRSGCRFR